LATPVFAAAYSAPLTITESNGTGYDMLPVSVLQDNQWLVDNGFIASATALDTRVETLGGLQRPHMVVDDRTLTSVAVPADSQTNLFFTTDNALLTVMDIITGIGGFLTRADVAGMEFGDDFESEIDGYVDTTATSGDSLVYKKEAIDIFIDGSTNITAGITSTDAILITPFSGYAAWVDVDTTDYIPNLATGVILQVDANALDVGFRMNGSTDNRTNDFYHNWVMIGVDSNGIFEAYLESSAVEVYIVGYTDSSWNFNTNADDISLAAGFGAWTDIDVTALTSATTTGVIVEIESVSGAQRAVGVRNNGSVDARNGNMSPTSHYYAVLGVDTDEIFEMWAQDATVNIYLIGYIEASSGATFRTDGFDYSLGGAGAWTDIDASAQAPNADFLIFEVVENPGAGNNFGFRKDGSTEAVLQVVNEQHAWVVVECDDSQVVEGYVNNLNQDFFLIGYITSGGVPVFDVQTTASGVASAGMVTTVSISTAPDIDDYVANANVGMSMGGGIVPVFLLEEQTLGAPAASVTFSNIATDVATWDALAGVTSRHLVIMINAASPDAVAQRDVLLQLNADSGANYTWVDINGVNAVIAASYTANQTSVSLFPVPGTTYSNAFGGGSVLIPAAFLAVDQKVIQAVGGAVEDEIEITQGRWADTSAITSVRLTLSAGNFIANTKISLGVVDERYLIEEDYLSGGDGLPSFLNIPQSGGDLVVIGFARSDHTGGTDVYHEINGDGVDANYSYENLGHQGGLFAQRRFDRRISYTWGDSSGANQFTMFLALYTNYAGISNDPHFRGLGYASEGIYYLNGRRSNIAAITQLDYLPKAGVNFRQGSLFSLYQVPRFLIERQILTASQATITFNNIPSTYEAFQINVYARSDLAAISENVEITINTDAVAANYDWQTMVGDGAVTSAARNAASQVVMVVSAANEGANEFGGGTITFNQYSTTVGHKHFVALFGWSGTTENIILGRSSRWEDTSAITRIDLDLAGANNFVAGSIFELVGVMPSEALQIDIDGSVEGAEAASNHSVPDNSNNWVFMSDATPYLNAYDHTVGGSLITRYEPSTMIIGTTLPDREVAGNDATITFGNNPAGVTVALGSMVSASQPVPGGTIADDTLDILPDVEASDWFLEPDVSGTLLTNPVRPFVTMLSDNTTLTEIQSWRLYALAIILLVTVGTARAVRSHLLLSGIAAGVSIGAAVALTIFPMWALVFAIGGILGGVVAERSPSL
tara:strand:+ start:318 stop:4001 length:3684 start_codon:yes stop_codon:yes gene_type:complete